VSKARQPSAAYWTGKQIVVTGGTGFLGSHLSARLRELGATVVSCSRGEGCDLRDAAQAQAFIQRHRPEMVFNCAAHQGGVAYQRIRPGTILHDNVLMGVNTMEAARLAGVQRYVNIIAACAYPGDPANGLLREDEIDAAPMHPSADNYGISKRLALLQAKHYEAQYGLPITSVAFANTYGPGDHFSPEQSHVLAALLRRFYEAERDGTPEVVVWGRGLAERDLLYVDDAITGLLLIVEHAPDAFDLVNVGSGTGHSVKHIANTLKEVTRYSGSIAFDHSKPEGPLKKTLDITRLQTLLGWTPPTSLTEGTRYTLAWLSQHYQEAVHGR
jgi:GDP-L-fucose synthase